MIRLTIPGPPVAWARARQRGAQRFTAPDQARAKRRLQQELKLVCRAPHAGPVHLTVRAYMPIPPSCSRAEHARRLGAWHMQKPDADNIAKLIKDAANGVVYKDDSQVASLTVLKVWSDNPRTEIIFDELNAERANVAA